jgi:hypothetical protein
LWFQAQPDYFMENKALSQLGGWIPTSGFFAQGSQPASKNEK